MGHNQTLGGGGFHHVAIRVKDFARSRAFYEQGLGFVPKIEWGHAPHRALMLDTGDGNYLEIFERPQEEWSSEDSTMLHFALRTTDTDAALAKAVEAGAEVTVDARDVTIVTRPGNIDTKIRLAFIKGPDGEVIEFFQNETT
ncbi:MAG: VOC family protein [Phycisphaera sp.]|nr:VOC family protein [Phycisphaera sp.]